MRKHLEALVAQHGGVLAAVQEEWDEFWAYYSFWLSGLWVTCEGIERVNFGDEHFITFAKECMSLLHPIRQATFHYKPNTAQMMRHFDSHEQPLATPWAMHERIMDCVAEFLASLPDDYLEAMEGII